MPYADKNEAIQKFLDQSSKAAFGRTVREALDSSTCVICSGEAHAFKNLVSMKEYRISGMCQKCQDNTFEG